MNNKPQRRWLLSYYPERLLGNSDRLLDIELPQYKKPKTPIIAINSKELMLQEDFTATFRNHFLLPFLVVVLFVVYMQGEDIYLAWKETEASDSKFLEITEKQYGKDYLLNTENETVRNSYAVIGDDGKLPFKTYFFEMRYSPKFTAYPKETLQDDITLTAICAVFILTLGPWAFFMRRRAPLIIDREHGLAYSWWKGAVCAERLERLKVVNTPKMIRVHLYFINPKRPDAPIWWRFYKLQPSCNPYFPSAEQRDETLAAMVKFIEYGQSAVWPENWQGRRPFYIFDDKKPDNFEEQLAAILKVTDQRYAEKIAQETDEIEDLA